MATVNKGTETETLISAREICDRFKTPFDTTAKVLQILNNNGVLKSTKGIKGGYSLQKPLKEISFNQLNQMIEGKNNSENFCESSKGVCDLYSLCNIVTPLELLNKKMNQFLDQLSLEELFENDIKLEEKVEYANTENL